MSLFLGKTGGCLGETSALLLLLGGLYLVLRRVIRLRIPLTYLGTVALLTLLFPTGAPGRGWGGQPPSSGWGPGGRPLDGAADPPSSCRRGGGFLRGGVGLYHRPHSVFRLLSGGGQLCHFDDERLCGPPGQGRGGPGGLASGERRLQNEKQEKRTYRCGDPISHHRRHGWPSCSGEFCHCRAHCRQPSGKKTERALWGSSGRVWSWESSWNPSRMKPVWWKGSTKPPTDMWWR